MSRTGGEALIGGAYFTSFAALLPGVDGTTGLAALQLGGVFNQYLFRNETTVYDYAFPVWHAGSGYAPQTRHRSSRIVRGVANRNVLGLADREGSLDEGQIPTFRGVRVHVSTGCNRGEGNRRASRNGRVSDLPPPNNSIRNFVIAEHHTPAPKVVRTNSTADTRRLEVEPQPD